MNDAPAEAVVAARRVPRERRALGRRAWRGQRKNEGSRCMVRDAPGLVMMLLVDVPVEDRDRIVPREDVERARAVGGRPVPIGVQIEERAVREDDERGA